MATLEAFTKNKPELSEDEELLWDESSPDEKMLARVRMVFLPSMVEAVNLVKPPVGVTPHTAASRSQCEPIAPSGDDDGHLSSALFLPSHTARLLAFPEWLSFDVWRTAPSAFLFRPFDGCQ